MKNATNKLFSIILFMLVTTCASNFNAQAQTCKRIEIASDSLKKRILLQFIQECRQNRFFIEDKGIVSITAYIDKQGKEVWSMYAMIDDRYKDNPPINYSIIGDDVILVYQADSNGRIIPTASDNIKIINQCLENVIANRVYQRPAIKERYVEIKDANNESKKVISRTLIFGNYWNSKRLIFNKDGTYKILTGV